MNKKNIDSSPISHLEDIFDVKQEVSSKNQGEISLLTEIHDQKVIMDFQWIKDLKVLITSFSIDNYEYSFLTHHINRINNNLVIGTLKQNTNNKIVYKHSLPISGNASSEDIRLYLENILSEFNHLVSVLLKSDKIIQQSHNLINQKIVGHA
ncbi:YbjN domain-containing protein [Alphaproteobacteria bacterium]|nr:YbjN domain-containing protein [Alphaproteobacteria bacterium]